MMPPACHGDSATTTTRAQGDLFLLFLANSKGCVIVVRYVDVLRMFLANAPPVPSLQLACEVTKILRSQDISCRTKRVLLSKMKEIVALLGLLLGVADGFYLPGVTPQSFAKGDE